jgi:ABC-type multidrug transport system fused ATPase/permease subunit
VKIASETRTGTTSQLLLRLWRHLSRTRQRQFGLLLVLMLASGFAEVISLGSVLPFLGLLTSPDRVLKNPTIASLARALNITSSAGLLLPVTGAFVAAAILAGAIRVLVVWASTRLTSAVGTDLSTEVYGRTLYQPYSVHVSRNSSAVISGVIHKVDVVVFNVILPFLSLISSGVLLVAVMLVLILIDPLVASFTTVCFGACYAIVTWLSSRRLRQNSGRIAVEQTQVVKALQEGLGGIRDVLLDGTQPVYCAVYRRADIPLRRAQGNNYFISGSPRPAMEAVGMVLIAGLGYGISRQEGGLITALPALGALAVGTQRLLPALQQGYVAWATIWGVRASLVETLQLLDQPKPAQSDHAGIAPLTFCRALGLESVSFRYTPEGPWVLEGVTLSVPRGARVALVGPTGSGKSTVLDLLMGLITPTEGQLVVDGNPVVGSCLAAWQKAIAHVPQSIFLADATFAENIAFGVPPDAIEMNRVRLAARQAKIADFIERGPQGYNAPVGERGVRLSGGQRQRIGIARALYKQAKVLVLDEATSALDDATEQSVIDTLEALDRQVTILMTAHRHTTVARCDTIFEIKNGRAAVQESTRSAK